MGLPSALLSEIEMSVAGAASEAFSPDLALLDLAVAALDCAGVPPMNPLAAERLAEDHLPELRFQDQRALQERTRFAL
jgi:hypothetical protein